MISDITYPRPHFARHIWQSLDGPWSYSFDETPNPGFVDWQGEINVPYPPESPCSGVNDPAYHPVIWYRRNFEINPVWLEDRNRVLLHFGAVDYIAQVWVNGELVATHEGGHTPFSADITRCLRPGLQEVLVRAADDPLDLEKPRGKQDWQLEPHAIWYPRTTGIWQPVWLEPVPETYLSSLRLSPDLSRAAFDLEARLEGGLEGQREGRLPSGLTLEAALSRNGAPLASVVLPVENVAVSGTLRLPSPASETELRLWLWSPENPVLFDLSLTLRQEGAVLDQVESYAGLRSVSACDGRFYLNNQPYFLQMVLDQGYWQDSLLAAPEPDAFRRDIEITKALGFNGVRKHQKIEDPRYLYWADRLGLVVWGELPSAYTFSPLTARRVTQEFIAMVERDYNHPCIVAWVPFNESWGIPDMRHSAPQRNLAQALYHLGKALDPTRLVIENDGWEHCETDLLTIHDYNNKPEVFARRYNTLDCLTDVLDHKKVALVEGYIPPKNIPVMLSEFGGIRLGDGKGWGYQTVQDASELLARLEPLMKAAYGRTLSGYCYTQLTDTFQEQNGLLTMDRRPKLDPAAFRQLLQEGLVEWQREK